MNRFIAFSATWSWRDGNLVIGKSSPLRRRGPRRWIINPVRRADAIDNTAQVVEVPAALLYSRHTVIGRRTGYIAILLVVAKEECAVAFDRTTEGASVVVEAQLGLGRRVRQRKAVVQRIVAKELIDRAVKLIAPGARDHVDYTAGGVTKLCRNHSCQNSELLHGVGLDVDCDLTEVVLQIADSIKQIIIASRHTAGDSDGRALCATVNKSLVGCAGCGDNTGAQRRQRKHAASVYRQLLYRTSIDRIADLRIH